MRKTVRKARTILAVQYAYMLEYRAELFLWAISTILPLIMMGPWMVAGASGRFPLGPADFARYFVAAFLVRQFSLAWVIYEFEAHVLSGQLSPRLLQPLDPGWRYVAAHLGEHLARLPFVIVLVAIALLLFPQAIEESDGSTWLPGLPAVAGCVVAIYGAFALRFLMQYALAMLSFWFERVSSFDRLVMIPYYFLSGLMAPLEVFPEAVREVVLWTPFPYLIWFPARLLTGGAGISPLRGFLVVAFWIALLHAVGRVVWRRGLRHYSAMGA